MLKITARRNLQDIEYKRALKAIESEPLSRPQNTSPNTPVDVVAPLEKPPDCSVAAPLAPPPVTGDPREFTTVLKVYCNHKSEFLSITNSVLKKKFLALAGRKAVAAFRAEWGTEPTKTMQDSWEVYQYPVEAGGLIHSSLVSAYREIVAGSNQSTLRQYHFNINVGGSLPTRAAVATTGV